VQHRRQHQGGGRDVIGARVAETDFVDHGDACSTTRPAWPLGHIPSGCTSPDGACLCPWCDLDNVLLGCNQPGGTCRRNSHRPCARFRLPATARGSRQGKPPWPGFSRSHPSMETQAS
jgi:hypothetical protein